jgi:predicted RNase H-like HicB family nuclease
MRFSSQKSLEILVKINMKNQFFSAVIHLEDGIYVAECPEIGTISQGSTIEESVANLKEATELYLEEFPVDSKSQVFLTSFELEYA